MKVLVTGANGFVAKNLLVHLSERADIEVVTFTRENKVSDIDVFVQDVDFVFISRGLTALR